MTARRPRRIVGRGLHAARDLGAIAVGRADIVPDRRFSDPAWTGNPGYRRLAQTYLTAARHLDGLIADAGLGWRSEEQLRFGLHSMLAALAPTNFPLTNPEVLTAALDTGGGNFIRGLRHLLEDVAKGSSLPAMVDGSTFTKGENIAATAGAVVQRTPVYELIQYRPLTEQVLETPLLVVPPMINKYYVADLAPGRSMIEDWVRAGQHVFAISWRNPAREHAGWNLDTYAGAVRDALDAVCEITGAQRSHALGICAGGIVLSAVAAHLAARGSDRLAGIGLLVSVLAHAPVGLLNALTTRATAVAVSDWCAAPSPNRLAALDESSSDYRALGAFSAPPNGSAAGERRALRHHRPVARTRVTASLGLRGSADGLDPSGRAPFLERPLTLLMSIRRARTALQRRTRPSHDRAL